MGFTVCLPNDLFSLVDYSGNIWISKDLITWDTAAKPNLQHFSILQSYFSFKSNYYVVTYDSLHPNAWWECSDIKNGQWNEIRSLGMYTWPVLKTDSVLIFQSFGIGNYTLTKTSDMTNFAFNYIDYEQGRTFGKGTIYKNNYVLFGKPSWYSKDGLNDWKCINVSGTENLSVEHVFHLNNKIYIISSGEVYTVD